MATVPAEYALALAAVLFALGLTGVLVRRNMIYILMSIEIMLNASGLAFISAGYRWAEPDGQVMFVFILTLAAAEVSVALAVIFRFFHRTGTLDMDKAGSLKG
ncbi:MAG: NADH-quinone oxidoreductase subunit NuoK [Candidatus Methylomirabilis sp.]|nr:NADH-quinone oxidoreductase subunit NuoK [Deltaproteobacteria bacterium]